MLLLLIVGRKCKRRMSRSAVGDVEVQHRQPVLQLVHVALVQLSVMFLMLLHQKLFRGEVDSDVRGDVVMMVLVMLLLDYDGEMLLLAAGL